MKLKWSLLVIMFMGVGAVAGVLPRSRGGTGTSTGQVILPAGTTVAGGAPLVITAGSTLATPVNGSFESNGTNLYWTNSSGSRFIISKTAQ